MAYKGSFYYDEFDYGNYPESLDYDSYEEHLPTLSDVFNCGVSVSRQIVVQLLCLLSINILYRVIRNASKLSIIFCASNASFNWIISFRSSRLYQTFVFFFARIFLNLHLFHHGQLLRLYSCVRILCFLKDPGSHWCEEARIYRDFISNSFNFYLVRIR